MSPGGGGWGVLGTGAAGAQRGSSPGGHPAGARSRYSPGRRRGPAGAQRRSSPGGAGRGWLPEPLLTAGGGSPSRDAAQPHARGRRRRAGRGGGAGPTWARRAGVGRARRRAGGGRPWRARRRRRQRRWDRPLRRCRSSNSAAPARCGAAPPGPALCLTPPLPAPAASLVPPSRPGPAVAAGRGLALPGAAVSAAPRPGRGRKRHLRQGLPGRAAVTLGSAVPGTLHTCKAPSGSGCQAGT